ncbi:hypothetical protein [Pleionea sediminis]|uniref:hypothetical protein n=1 Tax=Pleionea sediminis TaxID=2569479 RepID=UPI001185ADF0|nr:hypothetical protein [Pleionea sediminis]
MEIILEVVSHSFRFILYFLWDVVFEFLIRLTGYWICRIFSSSVKEESLLTVFVGLAFWVLIVFIIFGVLI